MLDDDDAMFATLAWQPTSLLGLVVGGIILALIWFQACSNAGECGKRHCEHGKPQLVKHECICTERAE